MPQNAPAHTEEARSGVCVPPQPQSKSGSRCTRFPPKRRRPTTFSRAACASEAPCDRTDGRYAYLLLRSRLADDTRRPRRACLGQRSGRGGSSRLFPCGVRGRQQAYFTTPAITHGLGAYADRDASFDRTLPRVWPLQGRANITTAQRPVRRLRTLCRLRVG